MDKHLISKKCNTCKTEKDSSLFGKDNARKDKLRHNCKECDNKHSKEWKTNNKQRVADYNKTYKKKYTYGMSENTYQDILLSQNNSCAICNTHKDELKRGLVIDHNHKTSKYRGLLCHSCNVAIGMLKESEDNLIAAMSYLRKHN